MTMRQSTTSCNSHYTQMLSKFSSTQLPPACLHSSFSSSRICCYRRAIRRWYSTPPATSTHQLQLRPLAYLPSSFPLCYQHPPVATAAARLSSPQLFLYYRHLSDASATARLLSPQLSPLLPAPIRRNCGCSSAITLAFAFATDTFQA